MEQIVLDIGSEVNFLTKKTWETMGKPTLKWPPVQLRMANQVKVIPLGIFSNVLVDLDTVRSVAEFEVIEIVDDSNPYLALLGIEWALNNNVIINLKRRKLSFDDGKNRFTAPIDPREGQRYVEPVKDERELDNIYNITSTKADYVDPDVDGKLS